MVKNAVTGALSETELQLIQGHFNFTEGNEKPLALWVIGRPAAGKTTVASLLRDTLRWRGHRTELVDGEHIRSILGGFYGFSPTERAAVFKKYVDLNQIFQDRGIIPVTATVGGSAECREMVLDNLENPKFIYLACSPEVAMRRDQKGLYARAWSGELDHFTDIHLLFSQPIDCEMEFNSAVLNPLEIVTAIMAHLDANKLLRTVEGKA